MNTSYIGVPKTKNDNGDITTKHYVGGIEYNGTDLEAVYHAEGRATYDPTTVALGEINGFEYEYSIKDHLGNSRVMFSDLNGNGQVTESEIIQAEPACCANGQALLPFRHGDERTRNAYLIRKSISIQW